MSKKKVTKADLVKPAKSGRTSLTQLRGARRKARYATQFARTLANRRRRLLRHLRSHPFDRTGREQWERHFNYGSAAALGLNSKGQKRERRQMQTLRNTRRVAASA